MTNLEKSENAANISCFTKVNSLDTSLEASHMALWGRWQWRVNYRCRESMWGEWQDLAWVNENDKWLYEIAHEWESFDPACTNHASWLKQGLWIGSSDCKNVPLFSAPPLATLGDEPTCRPQGAPQWDADLRSPPLSEPADTEMRSALGSGSA